MSSEPLCAGLRAQGWGPDTTLPCETDRVPVQPRALSGPLHIAETVWVGWEAQLCCLGVPSWVPGWVLGMRQRGPRCGPRPRLSYLPPRQEGSLREQDVRVIL